MPVCLMAFCVTPQPPAFAQSPASAQSVQKSGAGVTAEKRPPNILLIITDQQHADMMSCAGNKYLKTPAMDRLAREGIRFTNAYVTNPVCSPSRISIATGIMAGRFGILNNGMKARVPANVIQNSIGNLMKSAGYDTFYGGKVHMCPKLNPRNAGYDVFFRDQREALPIACIAAREDRSRSVTMALGRPYRCIARLRNFSAAPVVVKVTERKLADQK